MKRLFLVILPLAFIARIARNTLVFRLTLREKQIVAFLLLAFLFGWSLQQWHTFSLFRKAQTPMIQNESQ